MENKKFYKSHNFYLVLAITAVIAGCISPIFFKIVYNTLEFDGLGTVGDWFGGTTAPFFGFSGFLMIVAAFLVQKEELHAQQEELRLTRDEFKQQNETMLKQRFENTFFHLLTLQNSIIESLEIIEEEFYSEGGISYETVVHKKRYNTFNGRSYFKKAYELLLEEYSKNDDLAAAVTFFEALEKIEVLLKYTPKADMENSKIMELCTLFYKLNISYTTFFDNNQHLLGHYFRNLYHVLKFIDVSETLTQSEKSNYSSILRAQLSSYELVLIFYNVLSEHGYKKFKPLCDKYDIFQNMNYNLLIDKKHKDIYKEFEFIKQLVFKH